MHLIGNSYQKLGLQRLSAYLAADLAANGMTRLAAVLLLAICAAGPVGSDSISDPAGEVLVQSLRNGGYNIYFRHAQTDWSKHDQIDNAGDWTSCDPSRMRQLADEGRGTASAIGDAIRALGIPVGLVLASPYCRTVETARLMDLGPVETTTDIMNLRAAAFFGGRSAILRRARIRLADSPPAGTNVVLVGHGNVAREATPIYPDEAEAALFRPDGNGGFELIGRLDVHQWMLLAEQLTP